MAAALGFLSAHKGQVSPITLTLWGNDVFPAFDSCKDFACIRSRTPKVVAGFAARFGPILLKLRASRARRDDRRHRRLELRCRPREGDRGHLPAAERGDAEQGRGRGARFADVKPLFNPPRQRRRAEGAGVRLLVHLLRRRPAPDRRRLPSLRGGDPRGGRLRVALACGGAPSRPGARWNVRDSSVGGQTYELDISSRIGYQRTRGGAGSPWPSCHEITGLRSTPIPSISASITSPGFR